MSAILETPPPSSSNFRDLVEFYTLCYNNPQTTAEMKERFGKMDIHINVYGGVQHSDPRIEGVLPEEKKGYTRMWSMTYGHIDMIEQFYNSGKPYGFFCEDDIVVRKDLGEHMPNIIQDFEKMKLDILLLGYLTVHPIQNGCGGYNLALQEQQDPSAFYKYYTYPHDHWGGQCYMMTRDYAKTIVETYGRGYAVRVFTDSSLVPFNPDWSITKLGKSALVYPMFGLENGRQSFEHFGHWGQYYFHLDTFKNNHIEGVFI